MAKKSLSSAQDSCELWWVTAITEQEQSSVSSKKEKYVKPGSKRKAKEEIPAGGKRKKKYEPILSPNYMDMTCIHPESCHVAGRFMKLVGSLCKRHRAARNEMRIYIISEVT